MRRTRRHLLAATLLACSGACATAWAQSWPAKAVTASVVQTLTDKVKAALATPEARAAADRSGIEIRYLGPEALGALVQKETAYWSQVIKARQIQAD